MATDMYAWSEGAKDAEHFTRRYPERIAEIMYAQRQHQPVQFPNLLQLAEEGGCIPLVDITTNGFPNLEIAVDRLGEYLEQGKGIDAGYDTSVAVMDQTIGAVQRVVGTVRDADGYPPVTR